VAGIHHRFDIDDPESLGLSSSGTSFAGQLGGTITMRNQDDGRSGTVSSSCPHGAPEADPLSRRGERGSPPVEPERGRATGGETAVSRQNGTCWCYRPAYRGAEKAEQNYCPEQRNTPGQGRNKADRGSGSATAGSQSTDFRELASLLFGRPPHNPIWCGKGEAETGLDGLTSSAHPLAASI